jgi:hypothetical protein
MGKTTGMGTHQLIYSHAAFNAVTIVSMRHKFVFSRAAT